MSDDDARTPMTEDDFAWCASIVRQFVLALCAATEGRPDLVDGYLSGRYALVLRFDGLCVMENTVHPVDGSPL
jgi:hypothetical protein